MIIIHEDFYGLQRFCSVATTGCFCKLLSRSSVEAEEIGPSSSLTINQLITITSEETVVSLKTSSPFSLE